MKKLFNGKFLFILASSLLVLVLLTIGAFYLFNDDDDVFIKSGYILNPLSSTTEKYFFEENAGYKENLSSMVEFVDVDENTVSVLKDSFLHYLDESLSFLKKGAILDLDSVSGNKAVSFYNITSESIIEKKDSYFVIDSANGEITLKNFIGRISDNKYIIVGDLSLKMAGNDTSIKGDYFEVVYVEEGIVNIENKDVKYQVAAENTLIYVGNDKTIDLGDKKITVNGEDLMSITVITINGDENIEIVPKAKEETDEDDNGGTSGGGGGAGTGEGTGDGSSSGNGTGNGTGDGTGGEGGDDTTQPDEPEEEPLEVVVELVNKKITSTEISVVYKILNAKKDDIYKLQVIDLVSGKTESITPQVLTDVPIPVTMLAQDTKYLFTVIREKDNAKVRQDIIKTNSYGIKMEKSYATSDSLAYKITIDEDTDISNAKLTLKPFNESTGDYGDAVQEKYVDSKANGEVSKDKVISLTDLSTNLSGEYEVVFDGLESDTIYTAVLDEFSVASTNFKKLYNITVTSMTLKKKPDFSKLDIVKDSGAGTFSLSLENVVDEDSAIVRYTYDIYHEDGVTKAIDSHEQYSASPWTVKVGNDKNELKNNTNYKFNVIIEYFDNEKIIEYVTKDSIIFRMEDTPMLTVDVDETSITDVGFKALIKLVDNSCLIPAEGRKDCPGNSTVKVVVSEVNPVGGNKTVVYSTEPIKFNYENDEIKYNFEYYKLTPGTTYYVSLVYNLEGSLEEKEVDHSEKSEQYFSTKKLSSFNVDWIYLQGDHENAINAGVQFYAGKSDDTMYSAEDTLKRINKVVIKLYQGNNTATLANQKPLASKTITLSDVSSFKEEMFDTSYPITSSQLGLAWSELVVAAEEAGLSAGVEKPCKQYIITIEAYMDDNYQIDLINNVYLYNLSPILLLEETTEPILQIGGVTNKAADFMSENLTNEGTLVGYTIKAEFDRPSLVKLDIIPNRVVFNVYNTKGEKVKFYIKEEDGSYKLVDSLPVELGEQGFAEGTIYMADYGTPYEVDDDIEGIMRRGNQYYVGYVIKCTTDNIPDRGYPEYNNPDLPDVRHGKYELISVTKETPDIKMYVASSDADSITYKYVIKDPDNAIFKDVESENYSFYYTINEGTPKELSLKKVDGAKYNHFEGTLELDSLKKGDLYHLYYKFNKLKTEPISEGLDGYSSGIRTFDGLYEAKKEVNKYNFRYSVINDPKKDNKVTIKILSAESFLDRTVAYKLVFTDSKGHMPLEKVLWELTTCPGDSDDITPRCLSVDYSELKNAGMKSEENEINTITVTVTALYDNGLMGYDFSVGEKGDYRYCIMQLNSSENGMGNYVSYVKSKVVKGYDVAVWTEDLQDTPKGFYEYAFASATEIRYWGMHTTQVAAEQISVNLNSSGYYSGALGFINPKMISIEEMDASGKNTFYFSNVTEKVAVRQKDALINGVVLGLSLSGFDSSEWKREADGEYYVYVETWINRLDSSNLNNVVRPVYKVKVNSSNPLEEITAVIDGLKENTKYYFRIYTYMKQYNGYEYRQLYDASVSSGFVTSSYDYYTARTDEVFSTHTVGVVASDKIYGNRELSTSITLQRYDELKFNFDLIYALCEVGENVKCGIEDGETNILNQLISESKLSNVVGDTITDSVDITKYDLEFGPGKEYNFYIYARAKHYVNGEEKKRNIILKKQTFTLNALKEPIFTVADMKAGISDIDGYYIDFTIEVEDISRVLKDGKFYIKLFDEENKLVGNLKVPDGKGGYNNVTNYDEYGFDVSLEKAKTSKNFVIGGLKANTKYNLVVYNDVYINNYDENTFPGKEHRTYKLSKNYVAFSTNNLGVAFGNAITYGATEKSIIVTFLGGSTFDNVVKLYYTVGLWNSGDDSSTISGEYTIGENGKKFDYYVKDPTDLDNKNRDYAFIIDPEGMKNELGKSYEVTIHVDVRDPASGELVTLTSADVPGFEGKAVYVDDNK